MSGTRDAIYWDTCIFFALLKKEEHRQGEFDSILKSALAFDAGSLIIVTSAITITELMAGKIDQAQKDRFRQMANRSNFMFVDANDAVCSMASEIREYYFANRIDDLYPTTPDSIHVASAILSQASALITFDDNNKPKSKELAMSKMVIAGKIAEKYPLKICRPEVGETQPSLPLDAPNQIEQEGDNGYDE